MKKRFISMSIAAAALSMAISVPAFAGWVQDANGWGYQRDNGTWVGAGWFTDPEDGSIYYMDPDGYIMKETRVEGYWLGADGRRIDKTQEEIAREAARAEKERNSASPSKESSNAKAAANAAKSTVSASSTTRMAYQAEMKVYMDNIYIASAKTLVETGLNKNVKAATTKNNLETTYGFTGSDRGSVLSSTLWLAATKKSASYVDHAFETTYVRGALSEDEAVVLDNAYRQLLVAALGETNGPALYDQIFANLSQGTLAFTLDGSSDSGNHYTLTCGSGSLVLKVTCADTFDNGGTAASETTEETADTAAAEETPAPTTSVIVAGQGASTEE